MEHCSSLPSLPPRTGTGLDQGLTGVNVIIVICHFPGGSDGKVSACNAGDPGSIPGSGRSPEGPGEGNGNPLQHSCLENPMDGGA